MGFSFKTLLKLLHTHYTISFFFHHFFTTTTKSPRVLKKGVKEKIGEKFIKHPQSKRGLEKNIKREGQRKVFKQKIKGKGRIKKKKKPIGKGGSFFETPFISSPQGKKTQVFFISSTTYLPFFFFFFLLRISLFLIFFL